VRCWGSNSAGELGTGSFGGNIGDNATDVITNVRLGGPARKIEAGASHTCAIMQTDFMRCWGSDVNHQIGNAAHVSIADPEALGDILTGDRVSEIDLGDQHTCALLVDGQAKCWGLGSQGVLGLGNSSSLAVPQTTAINFGGASAYLISGGANHTCAVKSNGGIRCWGRGAEGQLGQGSTAAVNTPTAFASDIALFAAP
jgi:alpha-tubulin suppressor-like RCC1 family protein